MKRVRGLLPSSIEQSEALRGARAHLTLRHWNGVVGELLAERCQPERFERGTLWVAASGSAWAQELRMVRGRILAELNHLAKEQALFLELRVGVRPFVAFETFQLPEAVPEPPRDQEGTIQEIAARRLSNWPDEKGD